MAAGFVAVAIVASLVGPAAVGAQPALTYTISGRVTDAATGQGITGICVTASPGPDGSPMTPQWSTTTTAGGLYQLSAQEYNGTGDRAPYYVWFMECGRPTTYLTQYWQNAPDYRTATQLYLGATQPYATGIDAALQAGGWIVGQLTDAHSGAPLSGIGVYVSAPDDMSSPAKTLSGTTDSKGNYAIGPLPTENYRVFYQQCCAPTSAYADEYYNQQFYQAPNLVPVTAPKRTKLGNEPMYVGGVITGRVTDAVTGEPLAGVEIFVRSSDPQRPAGVTSYGNASDGTYRISGLPADSYTVEFQRGSYAPQYWNNQASASTANPISIAFYSTTPGINAALQPTG
jgi:hypothetical protein